MIDSPQDAQDPQASPDVDALMAEMDAAIMESIGKPNRIMAPFGWYGGKGNMARKLLPLLPKGKVYVEPYAGAASMFWHLPKPREVEVLNDLHTEVVCLFRTLQDESKMRLLMHRLLWTPYSLDEFRKALAQGNDGDDVSRAWAFFVRQNQGFSGKARADGDWSRAFISMRGMAYTASKWLKRIALLPTWHDRLTRVQLDNRDALTVIKYWDSVDTVFYLDPPYIAKTRVKGERNNYIHEQDDAHHAALVELLLTLEGQAMLSGYETPIYQPLTDAGWQRHEFKTGCYAAGTIRGSGLQGKGAVMQKVSRTEIVWVKAKQGTQAGGLFG